MEKGRWITMVSKLIILSIHNMLLMNLLYASGKLTKIFYMLNMRK